MRILFLWHHCSTMLLSAKRNSGILSVCHSTYSADFHPHHLDRATFLDIATQERPLFDLFCSGVSFVPCSPPAFIVSCLPVKAISKIDAQISCSPTMLGAGRLRERVRDRFTSQFLQVCPLKSCGEDIATNRMSQICWERSWTGRNSERGP